MRYYITCYHPGMETRKHIAEIVQQGLDEIQEEERLTQEFRAKWAAAQTMMASVAKEADEGAREKDPRFSVTAERNGDCIEIGFKETEDDRGRRRISFCPQSETRDIRCSASPAELVAKRDLKLDDLTPRMLGEVIGEMISSVLKAKAAAARKGR